jgi:putative FmdB family regulatory protein
MYEYECEACRHRFEVIQKFSDPLVEVCPKCGARKVQKLLSSPAIQFKGSGFYITDYARKGSSDPEAPKADTAGKKTDDTAASSPGTSAPASSTTTASSSSATETASPATSPSKNS